MNNAGVLLAPKCEVRKLVKQITEDGGIAACWHLDVSRADEVREVFTAVKTQFGKIDVLVNNAGIAGADKSSSSRLSVNLVGS